MGLGDEIMAAGEARKMRETDARKVCVVNKRGRPRKHPIWQMCPDMHNPTRDHGGGQVCHNRPGNRPYIDYEKSTIRRWVWKDYQPTPARLNYGRAIPHKDSILIEPNIKHGAPPLKQWGRWRELLKSGHKFVQVGPRGTQVLPGVKFIETRTLEESICHIAGMRAAVLPEGGLHHLAAALGLPAVVLFGAYITPRSTGYSFQRNLWTDMPEVTGWRIPHDLHRKAWAPITPELVLETLGELLDEGISRDLPAGHRAAPVRAHPPEAQAV